ncbi:xylose isomerase-like protein [Dipodascopsis uninucleata]
MTVSFVQTNRFKIAIASLCLGRAKCHDLGDKLREAHLAGFEGIELFYEDIKLPAKKKGGDFYENLLKEAKIVRDLCDQYQLSVIALQPFKNYEGRLDRKRHQEKIEKLKFWFQIAKIVNTDLIQIPSQFLSEGTTGDEDILVADLTEVADLGAKRDPPIRFSYEPVSWGAHVDTWQDVWRIIQKVDRPNIGICLDTFHFAAKVWADITTESGIKKNADTVLKKNLEDLVSTVPVEKVYFVQLSDAERLDQPMNENHPWYAPSQKPNMTWSRNARLFPYENSLGAYLPVEEITRAWIFNWGYRGWISLEIFNRSTFATEASVPRSHAQRGIKSWRTMVQRLKLDQDSSFGDSN